MKVSLVEDDHRLGSAGSGRRQVALNPAEVEIGVEPRDDKERVEVAREHLLIALLAGCGAREGGAAWQHGMDVRRRQSIHPRGVVALPDRDPVAHGRQLGARFGLVQQPAGADGGDFAAFAQEHVGMLVLEGDARGQQAGLGMELERAGEVLVPAERREVHGGQYGAIDGEHQFRGAMPRFCHRLLAGG